ncbi:MAG: hypothetical protein AB1490_04175 [Pseudomonadota bacterium]
MISLKSVLLATALVGAGVVAAAAQSGSGGSMQPSSPRSPGAANQNISPTTHCKTASGQVQLKSASSGSASGTTGSNTSGSSGMSGSSGASGGSISGVSPSIVATLPSC